MPLERSGSSHSWQMREVQKSLIYQEVTLNKMREVESLQISMKFQYYNCWWWKDKRVVLQHRLRKRRRFIWKKIRERRIKTRTINWFVTHICEYKYTFFLTLDTTRWWCWWHKVYSEVTKRINILDDDLKWFTNCKKEKW